MSVGNSAEEFPSIHALRRERLLVLSCGLPSHPLKMMFLACWEAIEFLSQFSTHQPPNVCWFVAGTDQAWSPAVEWALYTKGGSDPPTSSPRSEFTTLSSISPNEVCGEHEIAQRLIQDLLEDFSGRCWPRSPRELVFSRNSVKFQKIILPNWVHRRPFRQRVFGWDLREFQTFGIPLSSVWVRRKPVVDTHLRTLCDTTTPRPRVYQM